MVTNPSWDPSGSYTMVFDDEFTGSSLNTTNWTAGWQGTSGITGPINSAETAVYSSSNISVGSSLLNLELTNVSSHAGYPYTGACVTTDPSILGAGKGFQATYGAFEARIWLPASGGAVANWPAWWTDGQSWPADGELDIMEGLNGLAAFHVTSTLDQPGIGGPGPGQGALSVPTTSPYAGGWHDFGMNWTANQVDFYYDGVFAGSVGAYIAGSPMYLILNNTQGTYGGPTALGVTMQVDWVRVWTAGPAASRPVMGSIGDSFSSSSTLETLWYFSTNNDSPVTVSGGRAVIPCDTNGELLQTGTIYNLTSSYIYAKVTPAAGSGCDSGLELNDGSSAPSGGAYNSITWDYTVGSPLSALLTQAGVDTTVGTLTYSATNHAWLRIRESSGTIFWDTSADGMSWTNRFSHSHSIDVTGLYVIFYAYAAAITTDFTYVTAVNGGSAGSSAGGPGATGQVVLTYESSVISLEGPADAASGAGATSVAAVRVLDLEAGDTVQATAYQNSGGALNLGGSTWASRLAVLYLCPYSAGGVNSFTPPVTAFHWMAGIPASQMPALLTEHLGNDLNFLLNRPYFTGYQGTAQTGLTVGSWTAITIDTPGGLIHGVPGDNYGGWSAYNNNYAAQQPGWYLVISEVYAALPSLTTGYLSAGIKVPTSGGIAPSTSPDWYQTVYFPLESGPVPGAAAVGCYYLGAGETVQPVALAQGWSNTTWSTASAAATRSQFTVVWLSE